MKPSTELLDTIGESKPKPQAKVTIEIDSEPDYETLWKAYRAAEKAGDAKSACQALAAIVVCCEPAEVSSDLDD